MAALAGLVLLAPLLAAIALAVKVDSPGPVFFRQERVGRHFRRFRLLKFRTMVAGAEGGPALTAGDDPRVTRAGRLLRRFKLDELPQLVNVLRGEMSLVGPRPELPCYVERFRRDYEELLSVRPGLTDPASIKYADEAELLGRAADAEAEYLREVLPDKIALAKAYVRERSLLSDLGILWRTAARLVGAARDVGFPPPARSTKLGLRLPPR